ncbi:MAG: hypothetical protein NTZ35_01510 [Ignavibacteriales bacterium]|nr:hypothetical protein [Ignavibacteriales bacterium]
MYTFEIGLWADDETYKTEKAIAGGVYWGKEASRNNLVDGSLTTAVAYLTENFPVPEGQMIRDVRLVGMEKADQGIKMFGMSSRTNSGDSLCQLKSPRGSSARNKLDKTNSDS